MPKSIDEIIAAIPDNIVPKEEEVKKPQDINAIIAAIPDEPQKPEIKTPQMPSKNISGGFYNTEPTLLENAAMGEYDTSMPKQPLPMFAPKQMSPFKDNTMEIVRQKTEDEKIKDIAKSLNKYNIDDWISKANVLMPDRPLTKEEQRNFDIAINDLLVEKGIKKGDTFAKLVQKGAMAGVGQTIQAGFTGLEVAGIVTNNQSLRKFGSAWSRYTGQALNDLAPTDKRLLINPVKNVKNLINPLWYAYNVGQTIPSMMVTVGASGVAAKAFGGAGSLLKLSPTKIAKLAHVGAIMTGGVVGGSLEGAGQFRAMKNLGADDRTAALGYGIMTLASAGLNAISLDQMFKFLGSGSMGKLAGSTITEAITEYLEEPVGAGIDYAAKLTDAKGVLDQMIEGSAVIPPTIITTILFNGAASVLNYNPITPQEQAVADKLRNFVSQNTIDIATGESMNMSKDNNIDNSFESERINLNEGAVESKVQNVIEPVKTEGDNILNQRLAAEQASLDNMLFGDITQSDYERMVIEEPVTKTTKEPINLTDEDLKIVELINADKKKRNKVVGALDTIWNDGVVNGVLSKFDIFAWGWSTRYSKKVKRQMEFAFNNFKNFAYAQKTIVPEQLESVFKYFGENKDLFSKFTKYMETPDKYRSTLSPEEVTKFNQFRDMMLQYDGEAKLKMRQQVDEIIATVENKTGKQIDGMFKNNIYNELDYMSIFPGENYSQTIDTKLSGIKESIEKYNAILESPTTPEISKTQIKNNIGVLEDQIRMWENVQRHIADFKIRYFPMQTKPSQQGVITKSKNTHNIKAMKRLYSDLTAIEKESKGRVNLWEVFDMLPEEIQSQYFSNPAEQIAYYMLRSGARFAERQLIINCLRANSDIFISEEDFANLPEGKEKEYSRLPKELLAEHGYLADLYVNNGFKAFYYENLNHISKSGGIISLFSHINKLTGPLSDIMILNPLIMAKLNAQQLNMIDPRINGYVAKITAMRLLNPEEFAKLHDMSIMIGMNTGETSVHDLTPRGVETEVSRMKETAQATQFAKFMLKGVALNQQDYHKAVKMLTAIFSTSRTVAFEIMDNNTKVGATQWLYDVVKNMKEKSPEAYYKMLDEVQHITMTIPDASKYSMEEMEMMYVMKAYSERYAVAETIGTYGRTPWDMRQFLNFLGKYYQLRTSFMAGQRKLITELVEKEKLIDAETGKESTAYHINNVAAQRLLLQGIIMALTFIPMSVAGFWTKDWYRQVKRNVKSDAAFYISSGLFDVMRDTSDETGFDTFDKYLKNQYGVLYKFGDATARIFHLFQKERDYNEAVKELADKNQLNTLLLGRELYAVPSDPTTYGLKMMGKGWQGWVPMIAPPLAIIQYLMNVSDDKGEIGTWYNGEYQILAGRNDNVGTKVKAALLKYGNEMTGFGGIQQAITSKDVPAWMRILQATTGFMFAYNKDGKPIEQIQQQANIIRSHPAIVNTYVFNSNGDKRTDERQIRWIDMLTYAYTIADKKLGVGSDVYYKSLEEMAIDFKVFGLSEKENRKELKYIHDRLNDATRQGEYIKMKKIYNEFERFMEQNKYKSREEFKAAASKELAGVLEEYTTNWEKLAGEKLDMSKEGEMIFDQLYDVLEKPIYETIDKKALDNQQ